MTYCQNAYVQYYRDIEAAELEKQSRCGAQYLAEKNCKIFFAKGTRTKLDWDKISIVPLSEMPHCLSPKSMETCHDPYLSPLDEWVEDHEHNMGKWSHAIKSSREMLVAGKGGQIQEPLIDGNEEIPHVQITRSLSELHTHT